MSRKHKKVENRLSNFLMSDTAKLIISKYEKSQKPPNFVSNFTPPQVPPQIVGDAGVMSVDSLPINQCNFSPFDKINKILLNSYFLGYQEYSLLSQNGIINAIMQNYADDCTQSWITFFSKDTKNGADNDKLSQLQDEFERLDVQSKMNQVMEQVMLFGGCKIYPKFIGDDDFAGGDELLTPFYPEQVKKGSLDYLQIIEPLYATPLNFNATNPLDESYYRPTTWNIIGRTLHHTRLLHFAYNYVPTLLKPVYWFNGMPLVQLCLDYLFGFETVRKNIIGVSGRYNINVFKTNLTALLNYTEGSSYQSGQDAISRLELANALASNFSIFALDNNPSAPEEWEQFNMTIAGLDSILTENTELCCAAAQMPVFKLFGRGSRHGGGLGEKHNSEMQLWSARVHACQNKILRTNIKKISQMAQMNIFGKIDPNIDFKFNPIWKKSDLEVWQIQQLKQQINSAYFADGILEGNEIREALSKDEDSGYSNLENLNPDAFEEETELDEKAPKEKD